MNVSNSKGSPHHFCLFFSLPSQVSVLITEGRNHFEHKLAAAVFDMTKRESALN